MTEPPTPPTETRVTLLEERQQRQEIVVAQIHEILLLMAQRQQSHESTLERIEQQQVANARQIADNAQAIAQLQAILQERYGGNGQREP